jgi:hypothetical protein
MAEAQRSAFNANTQQLVRAIKDKDENLAVESITGLANLLFYDLDRFVDAVERIADAHAKT